MKMQSTGCWWVVTVAGLAVLTGCGSGDGLGGGRGTNGPAKLGPMNQAGGSAAGNSSTGGNTGWEDLNPMMQPSMLPDLMENPNFDPTCASKNITANRVLPTVMLVVDGSTSMDMPYGAPPPAPDGGVAPPQETRWTAIRTALADPTNGVLQQLQGLVRFGLALFGTVPSCPLPFGIIEPALNNAQPITNALPVGIAPGTFTPTGPALDMVVERLPDPTLVVDKVIGPQIIVLATDGDPNSCATDIFTGVVTDYAPSIAAAQKAAAKNLKMYVISVGMDAAAQHLQEMANIGAGMAQTANPGAPVYYPEDPKALADTLAMLIGDELSCDLALEGEGVKMGLECKGTVTLNGNPLECNGENGWELTDETHIRLKGTACETYKAAVDASLSADFPCEVIVAL